MVSDNALAFGSLIPSSSNSKSGESIFTSFSLGIASNRDEWVYDFDHVQLKEKIIRLIKNYNYEVFRLSTEETYTPDNIDSFVNCDPSFLKWTDRLKNVLLGGKKLKYDASMIRKAAFRPFVTKEIYFDSLLIHRRYQQHKIFPTPLSERENQAIAVSQVGFRSETYNTLIINCIPDLHLCASVDGHQCFPYYLYNEDGSNRRENVTDWALERFREHFGDDSIGKWDIFYYVYGVLHQPAYRMMFADDLKRELPRIPFMEDFWRFAGAGKTLADLHLNYETVDPWPLRWVYAEGKPLSYRVEKMKLSKDKTSLMVNETLTLADIPVEAFNYPFGNRSALEWIIDQYQVSTDKRSGIETDPNRLDDPEYIVHLVGALSA